jgi:hypothetical protein
VCIDAIIWMSYLFAEGAAPMSRITWMLVPALLAATMSLCWCQSLDSRDAESRIQAILKGDAETGENYRQLFRAASDDQICAFKKHSADNFAIQAAWEEVVRTLPEKSEQAVRPNRERLVSFLAFLEKRGHIKVSKWWAEAVLDSESYGRQGVHPNAIGRGFVDPRFKRDTKLAPLPIGGMLVKNGPILSLQLGSATAALPEDIAERIGYRYPGDRVTGLITDSRVYIAGYADCKTPYKLACIGRTGGGLRWTVEGRGSGWSGNLGGYYFHLMEVVEQKDRVVVFGLEMGDYVEAFRADDGVSLFRFSSDYSSR